MITEYKNICFMCGKAREATHHLIFGKWRKLCDEDGITAPICGRCHNLGSINERIHENSAAEKLSKIIGQLEWEKEYISKKAPDGIEMEAREKFRSRYGESFL